MCEKPPQGIAESDDEAERKKAMQIRKQSSSESSGDTETMLTNALIVKEGRNANNTLYYIDYTKLPNNGNGLEAEARNTLLGEKSKAEQEKTMVTTEIAQTEATIKQLLSEPTNEEAASIIPNEEVLVSGLREKLSDAQKLKVNEATRKRTKSRIDSMNALWRKRKRICVDFLITMEEHSDGAISMKKCLSGNGQIDVESDEKALQDSIAFVQKQRQRQRTLGGRVASNKGANCAKVQPDESFVGVKLDTQGQVERVFENKTASS